MTQEEQKKAFDQFEKAKLASSADDEKKYLIRLME